MLIQNLEYTECDSRLEACIRLLTRTLAMLDRSVEQFGLQSLNSHILRRNSSREADKEKIYVFDR
jgi:hypothetical protein